ncbi:MAG: hypothetical protein ACI9F9_001123, partial [Candidatus Paceibacteria bacterium]
MQHLPSTPAAATRPLIKKFLALPALSLATALILPTIGGAQVTEIIDATGDGAGNTLSQPRHVAADDAGNIYVTGRLSNNVLRITPGGTIKVLMDSTGDGAGNTLAAPLGVDVDTLGNVYVVGQASNNAF